MMPTSPLDRVRELARTATTRLRTWFDPPIDATARPLEIRQAIVDRVEALTEPVAAGRRVLTRSPIAVSVLAEDKEARDLLQAALADLETAVRTRLAEIRCPVPHGFAVDVHYIRKPRTGWTDGQRFAVEESKGAVKPAGANTPALRVTVLRGDTTRRSYVFSESKVLVGRTPAPVDQAGRPRRNHIVFTDEGGEHNATVGRAHASIVFDRERRQFRLFDDGSHNGTRIVRGGDIIDVRSGNPVGIALLSGDELHFGTAAVKIEIDQ